MLEEAALATIFDTYYPPIYRYIYHHIGHEQTVEDLAAEVFSRLLEHLNNGRGPRDHLKAWLYRVAHNLVVDELRRRRHRDHLELDERLPDQDAGVEDEARRSILAARARGALADLTPKQRSVIVMKYLQGMSNDEVASALALPVGAVKSLQNRGLAALRRSLVRGP
jgi:RNA polymerase sigma-70 factor (ECF subfamily)